MTLTVRLCDGFNDDTVTMEMDGKQVFHRTGVTTNPAISYAATVLLPVEPRSYNFSVTVVGRLHHEQRVNVVDTPFMDVRVREGKLEYVFPGDQGML